MKATPSVIVFLDNLDLIIRSQHCHMFQQLMNLYYYFQKSFPGSWDFVIFGEDDKVYVRHGSAHFLT